MTFELTSEEIDNRLATLPGRQTVEPGAFDNFASGAGRYAMQGFAKTARAVDLLGAVGPITQDLLGKPGTTEAQDRYFKEHDEVFNRAVDYWTPKPGEVGIAGEVVGQLLGTLPQVFASPALAVGSLQLSTAEDLTRKGVDSGSALAAGAVQAAGLGLGIWVPILGKTLTQRMLAGGAGFNVAQGIATRGATSSILEGTAAEDDFKALDATGMTLDALLGLAFGGLAHIHPGMRAEGEAWQTRLSDWAAKLKPYDIDALTALRQAQHLGADSMPGKPVDIADHDMHVQAMRQAVNDLANDRPVNVEDMPRYEPDPARNAQTEETAKVLRGEVERMARDEGVELTIPKSTTDYPVLDSTAAWSAYDTNEIPDGWYVHGRAGRQDLKTGQVIQMTKDWNVADQYAKSKGSKWLIRPKDDATVLDLRDPNGSDMDKVVSAALKDFEDGDGDFAAIADGVAGSKGGEPTVADIEAAIRSSFAPDDIVNSAQAYDNWEWAGWLSSRLGVDFVHTPDGAVAMGDYAVDGVMVPGEKPAVIVYPDTATGTTKPASPNVAISLDDAGTVRQLDPLAAEASRFAQENPDLPVFVGKNADGSDITTTPAKLLEEADNAVKQASETARLFAVAAECLLGAS